MISTSIYITYCGILLLACPIMGLVLISGKWAFSMKLLVILSVVTLLVEGTSFFIDQSVPFKYIMYDFLLAFETGSVLYYFWKEGATYFSRRICRILLYIQPVGMAVCYIAIRQPTHLNEPVNLLYLFLELISSCVALIDVLRSVHDEPFISRPVFWVGLGMLVYASFFTIIESVLLMSEKVGMNLYYPFSMAGNTFMYGGFMAAFYVYYRQH